MSHYIDTGLHDVVVTFKNDSWDLGTLTRNASWSAYCEGLEQAKPGDAQAPTDQ